MKNREISLMELDFFEVYREYVSGSINEIREKYSLGEEDIKFVLRSVEETVCSVHGFIGDLERTAKQCVLPKKIVKKILIRGGKFISNSKVNGREFLYKKERI